MSVAEQTGLNPSNFVETRRFCRVEAHIVFLTWCRVFSSSICDVRPSMPIYKHEGYFRITYFVNLIVQTFKAQGFYHCYVLASGYWCSTLFK